jgi:hypothetical protein
MSARRRAKTPLLVQLGLAARKPLEVLRPEPFVLDGDIDTTSQDTEAWLAPLQQGGTRADRKLRAEFERRGGWLGRPRKPKSPRKRHQKAVTADSKDEMGIAA